MNNSIVNKDNNDNNTYMLNNTTILNTKCANNPILNDSYNNGNNNYSFDL